MRRFISIAILALLSEISYSQSEYSITGCFTDSASAIAGAYGEFSLNSTAINNDFFGYFTNGGYITVPVKDRISEKLRISNRLGGDLNYGLFFSHRIDSLFGKSRYQLNYFVNIANKEHFDMRFSEDFFNLGFYGNKRFAGDTADLGNFNFNLLRYQQFQVGLVSYDGMGNKYGAGLSFLKGEENASFDIPEALLFTSETGDEIDLSLDMKVQQTDTAHKGPEYFNGWGFSTDLFYEFSYDLFRKGNGKGWMRLEITDLGFIRWNESSLIYESDTAIQFKGLEIENIFDLQDTIFVQSGDSLIESHKTFTSEKSYTTALPVTFHFSISQYGNGKSGFTFGMMYRMLANYNPYVYFKYHYLLKQFLTVSGVGAYGGYGNFSLGLEGMLALGKFRLALGSKNLEGLVLRKYSGGNNGYLSLRKYF